MSTPPYENLTVGRLQGQMVGSSLKNSVDFEWWPVPLDPSKFASAAEFAKMVLQFHDTPLLNDYGLQLGGLF